MATSWAAASWKVAANVAAFQEKKKKKSQTSNLPLQPFGQGQAGRNSWFVGVSVVLLLVWVPHMVRCSVPLHIPPTGDEVLPCSPRMSDADGGCPVSQEVDALLTSQLHLPPTSPPRCLGQITKFYSLLPHLILKTFPLISSLGRASISGCPKATLLSDR